MAGTTMKYDAKRFKSAAVALKEIEPFIRNGMHLQVGKPFANLNDMRSREVLANWLICAVFNFETRPERLTFVSISEPIGGDGVMLDTETEETWPTEHVLVPNLTSGQAVELEARILDAIAQKRAKGGAAYAARKSLVILLNAGEGVWVPNRLSHCRSRFTLGPLGWWAYIASKLANTSTTSCSWMRSRASPTSGVFASLRISIGGGLNGCNEAHLDGLTPRHTGDIAGRRRQTW